MKKLLIAGLSLLSFNTISAEPSWVTDVRNGNSLIFTPNFKETFSRNISEGNGGRREVCDQSFNDNIKRLQNRYPLIRRMDMTLKNEFFINSTDECATNIIIKSSTLRRLDKEAAKLREEQIRWRKREIIIRTPIVQPKEEEEVVYVAPSRSNGVAIVLEKGKTLGYNSVGVEIVVKDKISMGFGHIYSENSEHHSSMVIEPKDLKYYKKSDLTHLGKTAKGVYISGSKNIGSRGGWSMNIGGTATLLDECENAVRYIDQRDFCVREQNPEDKFKALGNISIYKDWGSDYSKGVILKMDINTMGDIKFGLGFSF